MKSKNVKSVSYAKGPKPPLFAAAWKRPSAGLLPLPAVVFPWGSFLAPREPRGGSTRGTVSASHSVKVFVSFILSISVSEI